MLEVFLQFLASQVLYLALHLESGSFPRPLTPRQEVEAFAALRRGDADARDTIIRHNLRLVAHIVKKYCALPGDAEDLISIGTIGLIKAVSSFDSTKQVRFSTYASRCIENEIRMHLRRERKAPLTLSMQEPIQTSKDGSHLTVLDVVPDDFLLDEDCECREESSRLRTLVQQLTGRERQVILLRYGLSGQPPLTQQQVAQLLGISRSYVSRIEKAAVQELRAQLDPAR
ncbi:sigma-70 family RNA polymerase sigma factor [Allofournierella massiliensis]|uniref:RNA polymerase sigma factor n=2 Tax=Allofournierella massiliensis TaxID=1650663 RepID=A0A4R1QU59_9FIRM|nr:sigma-70 family RNA polymerase sigma factor [Fournierella massiliensis]TCL53670.1 RNA polymerase sporulation-specific sigma factor [Fournierella massiliensis]